MQYPPDFDPTKKYPLVLDIHGGPNTDYGPFFSVTHQIYAANGYIVLFTNPRGSIGYGEAVERHRNLARQRPQQVAGELLDIGLEYAGVEPVPVDMRHAHLGRLPLHGRRQ